MKDKIKTVFKAEGLSWEKFANVVGGEKKNLQVKVEGWAQKLNKTFNAIGYEVVFKKIGVGQNNTIDLRSIKNSKRVNPDDPNINKDGTDKKEQ